MMVCEEEARDARGEEEGRKKERKKEEHDDGLRGRKDGDSKIAIDSSQGMFFCGLLFCVYFVCNYM
jgi:hypothetical protein